MQKMYSQIVGMPVFDEYSRSPLALVQDVLIDPENGYIIGFLISRKRIIVPVDVMRLSSALHIQDRDSMSSINDVFRAKQILVNRIPIMGAKVKNTRKINLGKVVDYEIDTKTMAISHIFVAKTFFFFHTNERDFARKQIISITKKGVTVNDSADLPAKEVKEKAVSPSSAFA